MTSKPTFAELPGRALIAVGGADWRSFLQGLLTQDVETLAPGEARFAGLLTPQGRLIWDLFVVGREDGCRLDVARENRAAVIQRLTLYRLRAKVDIGPDEAVVSALFSADAATPPQSSLTRSGPAKGRIRGDSSPASGGASTAQILHRNAGEVARRDGGGVCGTCDNPSSQGENLFVRDPRLPALGWRGYGASAPADAEIADEAAYEAYRLSLGVPGPADWGSEKTYPIEADFDLLGGIDFKKGCFVGQETTSRMKRRGQIKTRMLPIVFAGAPPAPGAEVLAGSLRAGEVCSGVEGRAMALLRLDRLGGELTVDGRPVAVEPPAWIVEALGDATPA